MQKYKIKTRTKKVLADMLTPVSAFSRLREFFPSSVLLESSDYHTSHNSFSYIGCDILARIALKDGVLTEDFPDGSSASRKIEPGRGVLAAAMQSFFDRFEEDSVQRPECVINGFFGFLSYDSVQYMDDICFSSQQDQKAAIPDIYYVLYRYVLAIDHFRNELHILENACEETEEKSNYDILKLASTPAFGFGPFRLTAEVQSLRDDAAHCELIETCRRHIFRGDVFQIVPSMRFSQHFSGDDFNVYRALRSINPSPYLFYFDCGDFHLFGSSPEAQLVVKNGEASIHPIAGTYRRSGNDEEDEKAAEALLRDPKENSEHVMLVDLARNDLSMHCYPVHVEKYREVQLYSHVIHLVSKVTGEIPPGVSSISLLTSTFPAGTLSGAPKYKAMELLDRYEGVRRGFYGGAVGLIGFKGDVNHAILIRSFLSRDNVLYYQAGSGIVADSVPEREVEEVKNKLAALREAVCMAVEVAR